MNGGVHTHLKELPGLDLRSLNKALLVLIFDSITLQQVKLSQLPTKMSVCRLVYSFPLRMYSLMSSISYYDNNFSTGNKTVLKSSSTLLE